jgi:hypothetical protein
MLIGDYEDFKRVAGFHQLVSHLLHKPLRSKSEHVEICLFASDSSSWLDTSLKSKGVKRMSRQKPQAATPNKHPELFEADLNPNAMAGQNIGAGEYEAAKDGLTAYDCKQAHRRLANLTDDNLRQIRVLPEGVRLQQGATYIDLHNLEQGEFTATGDMQAAASNWFVAKKDVPYHLWNILLGIENQERMADGSDIGSLQQKSTR